VADGREVAVAGARRDLDARVLRVLHDKSFADDPTRLLRMARYAARLGFSAEAGTARLAAVAVAAGAPATVTGARLGNELLLLLGEPQPQAALALAAHGVGAALLGVPYAPDEAAVARAVALCPPGAHRGIAALATAIASSGGRWADLSSDSDEYPAHGDREGRWADLSSDGDEYPAHGDREGGRLAERLAALALPARERDLVVRAATEAPALAPWLAEPRRPSALWDRLRRAPAEVVTVAGGLEPRATESARRWLEDIRHVRAEITGSDLLERGIAGPAVGRGLDAALRARLDGEAPDRERQLAVALAAAG
jgi:tRNA nucleotidyltransferase (CCA-adding enzyme)